MLLESNGIKLRQALFFKNVELIEQGATVEEMEITLLKMIEHVDEELAQINNLPDSDPYAGLTSIIISHALGNISDSELSDEFNERQKLLDDKAISKALSVQYPSGWMIAGYLPTKLEGEKELGYPTLRQKYELPLEGDIETMDTMIEVELKPM